MPKDAVFKQTFLKEDSFITVFSNQCNFYQALQNKRYQKKLVKQLLKSDNVLKSVIQTTEQIQTIVKIFPRYQRHFIKRVARNKDLFSNVVKCLSDFYYYATPIKSCHDQLFKGLLDIPEQLMQVAHSYKEFIALAQQYPAYRIHLLTFMLQHKSVFSFYISNDDALNKILDYFSDSASLLWDKILNESVHYHRICNNVYGWVKAVKRYPNYGDVLVNYALKDEELLVSYIPDAVTLSIILSKLPDRKTVIMDTVLKSKRLYLKIFHEVELHEISALKALSNNHLLYRFLKDYPEYKASLWQAETFHQLPIIITIILKHRELDIECLPPVHTLERFIKNIIQEEQLTLDNMRYCLPLLNQAIEQTKNRTKIQTTLKQLKSMLLTEQPLTLFNLCKAALYKHNIPPVIAKDILPADVYKKVYDTATVSACKP